MKKVFQYITKQLYKLIQKLPDKEYLKLLYLYKMHSILRLKNPKRFQEKLQWLKLYYRDPIYTSLVDKNAVKEYVASLIGDQYVIPNLGVWDKVEDIDFKSLPNKFVLKTTHGGGSQGVIVCKNKHDLDIKLVKTYLQKSLDSDIYLVYREWPYKNVPKRIIAEKYIEAPEDRDLTDYKIYCFNGKPKYIQVIQDRNSKETIDFFDIQWQHQPFVGLNAKCLNARTIPEKPQRLEEMLKIAEKLAQNYPFIRVDLYNINSKIYFGELTFYPASGLGQFSPDEWSYRLGKLINLPNKVL